MKTDIPKTQIALVYLLSAYIFYATFKSIIAFPFDIYIPILFTSVIFVLINISRSRFLAPNILLIILAVIIYTPTIFNYQTPILSEKVLRIVTVMLPICLIAINIRIDSQISVLLAKSVFLLGTILALICIFYLNSTGLSAQRGGFSAPILISRSALLTSLSAIYLLLNGKINIYLFSALTPVYIYVAIATESRGPFAAYFIAMLPFIYTFARKSRGVFYLILPAIIAISIFSVNSLISSTSRFSSLFNGNLDVSSTTRIDAWEAGYSKFLTQPLGHGIDSFKNENIYGLISGIYVPLEYPHNFIIEVLYESGIFAFIFITFLVFIAIKRLVSTHPLTLSLVSTFLIYFTVNSLVSSDVPGNKEMWAFIFLAIAATRRKNENGTE